MQAPFVTVFLDINEIPEEDIQGRKDLDTVIKEVLTQRIKGVKNEKGVYITTAFPKLIYLLDDNNVKEGSEYWETTLLAAKCTAKRMVPDYISAKKMREYKKYSEDWEVGDVYPCINKTCA